MKCVHDVVAMCNGELVVAGGSKGLFHVKREGAFCQIDDLL